MASRGGRVQVSALLSACESHSELSCEECTPERLLPALVRQPQCCALCEKTGVRCLRRAMRAEGSESENWCRFHGKTCAVWYRRYKALEEDVVTTFKYFTADDLRRIHIGDYKTVIERTPLAKLRKARTIIGQIYLLRRDSRDLCHVEGVCRDESHGRIVANYSLFVNALRLHLEAALGQTAEEEEGEEEGKGEFEPTPPASAEHSEEEEEAKTQKKQQPKKEKKKAKKKKIKKKAAAPTAEEKGKQEEEEIKLMAAEYGIVLGEKLTPAQEKRMQEVLKGKDSLEDRWFTVPSVAGSWALRPFPLYSWNVFYREDEKEKGTSKPINAFALDLNADERRTLGFYRTVMSVVDDPVDVQMNLMRQKVTDELPEERGIMDVMRDAVESLNYAYYVGVSVKDSTEIFTSRTADLENPILRDFIRNYLIQIPAMGLATTIDFTVKASLQRTARLIYSRMLKTTPDKMEKSPNFSLRGLTEVERHLLYSFSDKLEIVGLFEGVYSARALRIATKMYRRKQ